jgi:hypothetical protein
MPLGSQILRERMDWREVKGAFLQDGSLRDVYVVGSSLDDWPALLRALNISEYKLFFSRGGEVQSLPTDMRRQLQDDYDLGYLLQVDLGGPVLNCHFFPDEEIEFDLDPRGVAFIDAAEKVFSFMSRLGNAVKKPVHLTGENVKEWLLFAYEPLPGHIVKKSEFDQ